MRKKSLVGWIKKDMRFRRRSPTAEARLMYLFDHKGSWPFADLIKVRITIEEVKE